MAEYIEKHEYIGLFKGEHNIYSWEEIEEFMDSIPTVDFQPIVHGRWATDDDGWVSCSKCGNTAEINGITGEFMESPYCSECGAKMDGEDDVR